LEKILVTFMGFADRSLTTFRVSFHSFIFDRSTCSKQSKESLCHQELSFCCLLKS
jgi:hypothetical protein